MWSNQSWQLRILIFLLTMRLQLKLECKMLPLPVISSSGLKLFAASNIRTLLRRTILLHKAKRLKILTPAGNSCKLSTPALQCQVTARRQRVSPTATCTCNNPDACRWTSCNGIHPAMKLDVSWLHSLASCTACLDGRMYGRPVQPV